MKSDWFSGAVNILSPVILVLLSFMASADTQIRSDIENISQLRSGEILHEHTRMDEAGGAIRVEILIRSTVEDIWTTVTGCDKAFIFVEGLKKCEILEETSEYALVHQVTDKGFFFVPVQDYIYESMRQALYTH